MTVGELLKLLDALAQVLEASGGAAVGKELGEVARRMEPLGDHKLKDFADLVTRAAGITR